MRNRSGCINPFQYRGGNYLFNDCTHSITASVSREMHSFDQYSLMDLSQSCYEAYEHRLSQIGAKMLKAGKAEYTIINRALIGLILEFNPLSFSFSISKDPSLHFVVRFPKGVSIFVETYLDLEDGPDTYLQIYEKRSPAVKINRSFDDCLDVLREFLTGKLTHNRNFFAGLSRL